MDVFDIVTALFMARQSSPIGALRLTSAVRVCAFGWRFYWAPIEEAAALA